MLAMLMGLGMSEKIAKLVAYIAIPLLIVGILYFLFDRAMDAAYDKGVKDTRAVYQKASDELMKDAGEAKTKADKQATIAAVQYAEKVEAEKEKIDDAIANGTSPYDVMFPAAK